MAGETLQDSLSGLRFSGADNAYGLGASTLASSLPALINPRSSVGRNLAIGLGGTLLTALLGYQARQQASEDTIATMGYGNQILGMTNPEDRLALAKSVGEQDSQRGARLATLVNALDAQGALDARTLGMQRKLQEIETLGNQAEALGIPMKEVDAAMQQNMTARQQPTVTAEGVPLLPPFPTQAQIEANAQALKDQAKIKLDAEIRAEAAKFARGNEINNRSTALSNNDLSKNLMLARASLTDLKNMVKSPTAFAGETMSKIYERVVNPANMVTLQELGTYANAQSLYDKLQGQWAKISAGEATTTPQFKAELIEFAQMAVDARGTLYNTMVQTAVDRANEQGLETTFKIMAPMPRYITSAENIKSLQEINAALALEGVDESTKQALRAQAVIIQGRR